MAMARLVSKAVSACRVQYLYSSSHQCQLRWLASMPGLFKSGSYVNGEFVTSCSGETFKVYNPANGNEIGEVSDMNVEDTKLAIEAAHKAFPEWSRKTGKERGAYLRKWFELTVESAEEMGDMLTSENGKPLAEARVDMMYAASFLEFYAEEAKRVYGETIPASPANKRAVVMKQPVGVAGLIIPWNFPPSMLARKAAPALAVGCTVVVKTPEDTPYTPMAMAELADRAGIPKGVVNVISCSQKNVADVGSLFCSDPRISTISFTGSTEVGRILMKDCAPQIKKLSLELGGLAPLILFDSANLKKAIPDIQAGKFRNTGQACISAQNILIQEDVMPYVGKTRGQAFVATMGKFAYDHSLRIFHLY
ncbi:glutarate-semialdehyde dehydrogenase-like [Watersipora subatra]|uniref:glutarate-semialdehyde dehydrogenase-like n=1 Tax=Watersipora subatra TaxID=2589382 RepID=UPI00355C8426